MAPATTNIIYFDYTGPMGPRSLSFRLRSNVDPVGAAFTYYQFVEQYITPLWPEEVATTGVRVQLAGSTISLPENVGPALVGVNLTNLTPVQYPNFISIAGRGNVTGKQGRVFIAGTPINPDDSYRFLPGENSLVDELLFGWQQLLADGNTVSAGDDALIAYPYANAGRNAYYQRKQR